MPSPRLNQRANNRRVLPAHSQRTDDVLTAQTGTALLKITIAFPRSSA